MTLSIEETERVWLEMLSTMRALRKYAGADIEEIGLGLSDFHILKALLSKGTLPVNAMGPMADLTPGAISIAVDRLVSKGLVTRVESAEDRRVRMVALSSHGRKLIVSSLRKHSRHINKVFSELSLEELRSLELAMKKVGKRTFALMDKK